MDPKCILAQISRHSHDLKENCVFEEFFISQAQIVTSNFKIVHKSSRPTSHIQAIHFSDCILAEIPRAEILLDLVQNLTSLWIIESNITKITCHDLLGLDNLKELYMGFNAIQKLPEMLFQYTPNIECISFRDNLIEAIDFRLLNHIKRLKYLNLKNNPGISVKYDALTNKGDVNLDQLQEAIEKCNPTDYVIEEMRKEIAAIKLENANLNKKVENLEKEFKKLKEDPDVGDFTVYVNGKAFYVNKKILVANSPMLAKIIEENPEVDQLELKHVSEDTFSEIFNFMQTKTPPSNAIKLLELFIACARLEIKELMDITAEMLMDKVTLDDAPDIIKLCKKFGYEELKMRAFDEIKKNFYGME